jgi:hypothetical protein
LALNCLINQGNSAKVFAKDQGRRKLTHTQMIVLKITVLAFALVVGLGLVKAWQGPRGQDRDLVQAFRGAFETKRNMQG